MTYRPVTQANLLKELKNEISLRTRQKVQVTQDFVDKMLMEVSFLDVCGPAKVNEYRKKQKGPYSSDVTVEFPFGVLTSIRMWNTIWQKDFGHNVYALGDKWGEYTNRNPNNYIFTGELGPLMFERPEPLHSSDLEEGDFVFKTDGSKQRLRYITSENGQLLVTYTEESFKATDDEFSEKTRWVYEHDYKGERFDAVKVEVEDIISPKMLLTTIKQHQNEIARLTKLLEEYD